MKDSSDEGATTKGPGSSDGASPEFGNGVGTAVSSTDEEDEKPRGYGEEACPSPVVSRTSRERASRERRSRSAGRGH